MAFVVSVAGKTPEIAPSAFVAPTAALTGDVVVGARCGVFYGASLRADVAPVRVGDETNLQDNVVVHADPGAPCTIGSRVTVGHGAVVHGCTVEDGCLIGMNATVMNHAVIGTGSLIAAGAVVAQGTQVPPGSLVAGVPAKVMRTVTADEAVLIARGAATYVELARLHQDALSGGT